MLKKTQTQILLLWVFLVFMGLISRSYFPIDETRYVTVAWNMWLNGDYLVPYLNGIAYSHKPPLLFWLINLGWKVFGVNDWWPRLVPSLFALATVLLTRTIAIRLWPNRPSIARNAPIILLASGLWVVYTTALMFDMLIAFFTALGALGLIISLQERSKKGWLLLTLAIGGGLLAKGPTILLQLLPVALLAPWWSKQKLDAKTWYLPIFYSVMLGAVIVLSWAIPAGVRGGEVYQHAIFWGQTADRMVDSFAHKRPMWWYLAILPILLFPWLLWGAFWKGIFSTHSIKQETGVRFAIAWALPVLLGFSFISGKQVHYVLPIFPAFALLIARYIENTPRSTRLHSLPISLIFLALGVGLLALPAYIHLHHDPATWLTQMPAWLGASLILIAVGILVPAPQSPAKAAPQLAMLSLLSVICLMYGLMHAAGEAYDVRPISKQVKILESKRIPVAYLGRYPGIYNFLGRLTQSPEVVTRATIADWFTKHPDGKVILFFDDMKDAKRHSFEFAQPYKGMAIALMNCEQWQSLNNQSKEALSE